MAGAISGFGGFRDIGDPYDRRREYGAVPGQGAISGLPRGTAYDSLALLRKDREAAIQEEVKRQALKEKIANLRPETPFSRLAQTAAAITGRTTQNTPEEFFSAQLRRPVSRELANRAQQFATAMPELTPIQALSLANTEAKNAGTPNARGSRSVSQEVLDKIEQISELKPDLAAQNAVLAAQTGTTEAVQANAATMPAEPAYERAAAVVDMARGDAFRATTRTENEDISAEIGRDRTIGGSGGRRNPFMKEAQEKLAETAFAVPVLVAEPDKNTGQPRVEFVKGVTHVNRYGETKDTPFIDTRKVKVAMLDPQMTVPAELAKNLNLVRLDQDDEERSGRGMNVPTPERNYFAGVGEGEPSYATPGFRVGDDPADSRIASDITLGQAIKQIALEGRTPIRTARYGVDVIQGRDGNLYTQNGIKVKELPNQPAGYAEEGLIEVRVGGETMITDEGLQKINTLLEGMPGMEGRQVLVNQKSNDPTINQAQNRLLQMAMSDDITGDPGIEPTRKPAHSVIKALEAGAGLPPAEKEIEAIEILKRLDGNDYSEAINPILSSSPANPAVMELRAKYQSLLGKPSENFYRYAEALGAPVGSDQQQAAMQESVRRQQVLQESSNVPQAAVINTSEQSQLNAPATQLSAEQQQEVLRSIPDQVRQNVERGLAEGASPASRQGALEFLSRFRRKMFN